jgi:hypothetical protein
MQTLYFLQYGPKAYVLYKVSWKRSVQAVNICISLTVLILMLPHISNGATSECNRAQCTRHKTYHHVA